LEFYLGLKLYAGSNIPYYLNPNHPNYEKWKRSRENSLLRGKFVYDLIGTKIKLSNCKILDFGSGFGGTILNFANDNNQLFSVEIDIYKLKLQFCHPLLIKINANTINLPFKEKSFDIIILQDVIEHIENPTSIIKKLITLLKDDGLIYLSTPNKLSILNLISDPHWSLPLISLMSRNFIKKFIIPIFRPMEKNRTGIAQLLSLNYLIKTFQEQNLHYELNTTFAVHSLFMEPKKIAWSKFHLTLLSILKKLKLHKTIIRFSNNKPGILNNFITPTFYFILRKNPQIN